MMFGSAATRLQGATPKRKKTSRDFRYFGWLGLLKPLWPALAGGLALALLFSVIWAGVNKVNLAINKIQFDQVLIYQNNKEFNDFLQSLVGQDLLRSDLVKIKQDIERLPWIASASVKFDWPGNLTVSVVEERPVAKWNSEQLISQTGKLFAPENTVFRLAELYGPQGRHEQVIQRYLGFNTALMSYGQSIDRLTLTESGAWEIVTDKGLILKLGGTQVQPRFERSLRVMSAMAISLDEVKYLDARYPNGVAIKLNAGTFNVGESST